MWFLWVLPPFEKGGIGGICSVLPYNRRLKTRARSLRTHPTDAELHLWYRLRRKQILGIQFYRQKPIGNYIADFYAPAAKLVIELDGAQHFDLRQAKSDAQRTRYIEEQGLKVLRFDDRQVLLQTESVLETIFQAMKNPS
jgi:very-short-patch-repair endonuclease